MLLLELLYSSTLDTVLIRICCVQQIVLISYFHLVFFKNANLFTTVPLKALYT